MTLSENNRNHAVYNSMTSSMCMGMGMDTMCMCSCACCMQEVLPFGNKLGHRRNH